MITNTPLTSSQWAFKLCDASNREHFGIRVDQVGLRYTLVQVWTRLYETIVKPAKHVVYKLLHRALHQQTALIKVLTYLHTPFNRDTPQFWETERKNLNEIMVQWGDKQISMCGHGSKTFVKDCFKAPSLKGSNKHSANEQHPPNTVHRPIQVVQSSPQVSMPNQTLIRHKEPNMQTCQKCFM